MLAMSQRHRLARLWLFQFAADFLAVILAYHSALYFKFRSHWGEELSTFLNRLIEVRDTGSIPADFEDFYIAAGARIVLLMLALLCFFYAMLDLYAGRRFILRRAVAWNVLLANVATLLCFYAYFYLSRNVFHPRSFFAVAIGFDVVYCVILRGAADWCVRRMSQYVVAFRAKAVLVGRDKEASILSQSINEYHPEGIWIEKTIERYSGLNDLLGQMEFAAKATNANMIIVADNTFSIAEIMSLLDKTDSLGLSAKILSDKLDPITERSRVNTDMLAGIPFVHFESQENKERRQLVRLWASRILVVTLLPVILPVLAVIALLVRMTSRGPALFIQERIGVNRRPFRMFKFRTMYDKADELQAQVEEFNESGAALFKIRKDPRVTPIGRFLRRFSLDELPQVLNVLRGDMTIIGPRPLPRRDFENYYEEWHCGRHAGMPGLTCLWQVSGRSDLDFHTMCILDVYYLRNQTWILDLRILLKTIRAVLFAKGAY